MILLTVFPNLCNQVPESGTKELISLDVFSEFNYSATVFIIQTLNPKLDIHFRQINTMQKDLFKKLDYQKLFYCM